MDGMNKVVIAGGSGFVGGAVSKLLTEEGFQVVHLGRTPKPNSKYPLVVWDGVHLGPWKEELEGCVGVINLAGTSISKPWTEANKKSIVESRVFATKVLGEAIAACQTPPKVWVNASAVGYYGDRGENLLTEQSAPGNKGNFLVDTCVAWETTFKTSVTPNTRKNIIRTGFVIGNDGGAFPILTKLTKYFLGGSHGSGQQYMSWIHVNDIAKMYLACLTNEMPEVLNGAAPNPVTNNEFMASMRAVLNRPWSPPAPVFALKIAEIFGAPDSSLLLTSTRAIPSAVQATNFAFSYVHLRDALADLLLSS